MPRRRRRRHPSIHVPVVLGSVQAPLWACLRAATAAATVTDLHVRTAAHPSAIRMRLRLWRQSGLIQVEESSPLSYRLTDHGRSLPAPPVRARDGALRPRRTTATQRLWTTMRVLGRFDVPTLEMTARAGRRATAAMVSALFKAGYLRKVVDGGGRRNAARCGWSTYHLARNTGPIAPTLTFDQADRSRKIVIDGNTGERTERVAPPKKAVNHVR